MEQQTMQTEKKMMTTEELLSDFFFLIFIPNPAKNNVRVIIDDGTIKLYTNIPKFIKIIEGTMNLKAATIVKNCCETYGCFYLIDRCEDSIRKLNNNPEEGVINLKNLHKEIMDAKEAGESNDKLREEYINALESEVNKELTRGSQVGATGNRYSATIIYGQQPTRGYRPY